MNEVYIDCRNINKNVKKKYQTTKVMHHVMHQMPNAKIWVVRNTKVSQQMK